MRYRTTCPHCTSVFRLGPDQLDAAQGWVQCGVCGSPFDARPGLRLEDGSPLPPEVAAAFAPAAVEDAAAAVAAEEALASIPIHGDEIAGAETPVGIAQRAASIELDLPSIILIEPDAPVEDDPGPLPNIYPPPAPPKPGQASAPAPAAVAAKATVKRPAYVPPEPGTARIPYSTPRRSRTWAWAIASVLLLALLLAQATYFLRDTLASRLPQSRPALTQACAVLGCTLSLPKELSQLQIVGSDLQTESRGRLKLTLTLGNRADDAQAWPMLVLTLTDQRNHPLTRRSFAPSEYLEDTHRIAEGIPPRSEQPLSLPLAVRDVTPMGFDVQLSY